MSDGQSLRSDWRIMASLIQVRKLRASLSERLARFRQCLSQPTQRSMG